jgi:hypothetical protein
MRGEVSSLLHRNVCAPSLEIAGIADYKASMSHGAANKLVFRFVLTLSAKSKACGLPLTHTSVATMLTGLTDTNLRGRNLARARPGTCRSHATELFHSAAS